MDLEKFNSYCEKDKNIILEEMFELYSLVTNYPTSVEDLKTFTEWQLPMGKFGKDMKDLLYGVYPSEYERYTDYTKEDIAKLSNKATYFVRYWNNVINK